MGAFLLLLVFKDYNYSDINAISLALYALYENIMKMFFSLFSVLQ